jgi:hypothetical protein
MSLSTRQRRAAAVADIEELHQNHTTGTTARPTPEWIAGQITQAFPWDHAARYLICDRDAVYGELINRRFRAPGTHDHLTALRSPWQNAYAKRLIGSVRREWLDHEIGFGAGRLRRIVKSYASYYKETWTHLYLWARMRA